jgi:hypothetical protein
MAVKYRTTGVRLTAEQHSNLKRLSKYHNMSISELLRHLIVGMIENRVEITPPANTGIFKTERKAK